MDDAHEDDSDDQVIDLAAYLKRREEEEAEDDGNVFTLWGGEGERARFALPLWRAAYLAEGRRSGLLWVGKDQPDGEPEPLIVLDLREEKARLEYTPASVAGLLGANKPGALTADSFRVAVYLGEDETRRWFLVIDDLEDTGYPLATRPQNDLLFLAGECAGLLFFRGLAVSQDGS